MKILQTLLIIFNFNKKLTSYIDKKILSHAAVFKRISYDVIYIKIKKLK